MRNEGTSEEARWFGAALSRRTLLRGSLLGGAGLAAAALIGCGDDDDDADGGGDATETATSSPDASGTAAATPESDVALPDQMMERFADPGGSPKSGGRFIHGHSISISNIDPIISAAGGTVSAPNAVYDRLVGFRAGYDVSFTELEIEPELASAWETSEDGLTMTFDMTEGIKWQNVDPLNGRDFTAADVKYAYDRYMSDESAHKGLLRKVASVDAPSATTLVLNLHEPWPDALTVLGQRFLTIYPQELVDNETISTTAVGTGPFILTEITEDGGATFDRNPDYWGKEVYLDGYDLLSISDASARLARFRVGQLDHAESLLGSPSDARALVETNPDVRIALAHYTYSVFGIALNLELPKYQDERVRQALSMAIDRELIIDIVMDGLGTANTHMPWTYVFDQQPTLEQIPNFAYNPDEAKKLLSAAGADGLEMDMVYYEYAPSSNSQQDEIIQQNFSEVGVNMNLSSVDYTEFNSSWIPGTFADVADGWAPQNQHADNFWHDQLVSDSPANRWNINDPQVDEWAVAQSQELDPDARKEVWTQIFNHVAEKAYRLEKPYRSRIEPYQPWVKGGFFGGLNGANLSYYDMGHLLPGMWLDK